MPSTKHFLIKFFRSNDFLRPQVRLCGYPDPVRRPKTLSWWTDSRTDLWPALPNRWSRAMYSSEEIPQWVSVEKTTFSEHVICIILAFIVGIILFSTDPSPFDNIIEEVIHPCNPNPCPSNHLCEVNRKGCHPGQACLPYFCVPGTVFLLFSYCSVSFFFRYSRLIPFVEF